MQVLIVAHTRHDGGAHLVFHQLARVAMRNTCGKFLHAHIRKRFECIIWCRYLAATNLSHAPTLECNWVECASDREVVAHHNGVSALFCCPVARPLAKCGVAAEQSVDVAEVIRKVVLSQQVEIQSRTNCLVNLGSCRAKVGIFGHPLAARFKIFSAAVRNEFVGKPFFGNTHVTLEQFGSNGLKFFNQRSLIHG